MRSARRRSRGRQRGRTGVFCRGSRGSARVIASRSAQEMSMRRSAHFGKRFIPALHFYCHLTFFVSDF